MKSARAKARVKGDVPAGKYATWSAASKGKGKAARRQELLSVQGRHDGHLSAPSSSAKGNYKPSENHSYRCFRVVFNAHPTRNPVTAGTAVLCVRPLFCCVGLCRGCVPAVICIRSVTISHGELRVGVKSANNGSSSHADQMRRLCAPPVLRRAHERASNAYVHFRLLRSQEH